MYVTFGSMSLADPQVPATLALIAAASARAGCRAIVQCERRWHEAAPTSAQLLYVDAVDHEQVFPRCALVVHHGGAGTTHAATLAGRPSVVIPHLVDQSYWGKVLYEAGIAPRAIDRRQLTVHRLTRVLDRVLRDAPMRQRAERLGAAMQQEDGVGNAIAALTKRVSAPPC